MLLQCNVFKTLKGNLERKVEMVSNKHDDVDVNTKMVTEC